MFRLLHETFEAGRIAWDQLRANKMRSFLTALGVIIGIVAITLMGTAIRGIETGVDNSLAVIGTRVLYVNKWPWRDVDDWWVYRNRREIDTRLAGPLNRIIDETPDSLLVRAVPADSTFSDVRHGDLQVNFIFTLGITHELPVVSTSPLAEGRLFTEVESRGARDVCIIGFDVADALFPNRSPLGERVEIRGRQYEVIGVVERQGSFLGLFSWDAMVGIPLATFQRNIAVNRDPELRVAIRDGASFEAAKSELEGHMRRVRGLGPEDRSDFEINDQGSIRAQLDPITGAVTAAGLFITGLSLFVGAIGIMNITYVSVKERTKEIGTRKALGARRRTILTQFLVEAVAICLVGGLTGLLLSAGVFAGMAKALPNFPASFSPELVVTGIVVSVLTGVVSGFAPALSASRLDPVEALRYE